MATTTVGVGLGLGLLRDRLSDLPDSLLVTILSGLPMDEAARCSILASRWRRLFPSTLLDFKAVTINRWDVVKAVTDILAAHPTVPIRSFRTGELSFRRPENKAAVDSWLRDLSTRGIEELSLRLEDTIPESIFACSSLKRLRVSYGTFPDATVADAASLARLTEIDLFRVKISADSLQSLLSHCTVLEHLTIYIYWDLESLHLRSHSLKVVNITGSDFKKLFIEDAPRLQLVLDRYMNNRETHIKVENVPNLEFLGYLGMSNRIEIGDTSFTEELIHVKTLMPSIRTIAVELSHNHKGYMDEGYIDWFMQLLKLFPRMETLYIRSSSWSFAPDDGPGQWEKQTPVPCMENHLEKVVFQIYRGHKWQREMAKFLHGRSRFLKSMEFHCMDMEDLDREGFTMTPSEEWVRKQKALLCLDSSAAGDASFLFFKRQMTCTYLEDCHDEQYKRNYYCDLYLNESVLRGKSWR